MFGRKSAPARNVVLPRGAGPVSGAGAERRGLTLELSPAIVIAATIGFVVVLAWVFVFGIIVGRGYNPETRMPGGSLLPAEAPSQPEKDILKPEDLSFMKELKRPADTPKPGPAPEAAKPAAQTPVPVVREAPAPSPVQPQVKEKPRPQAPAASPNRHVYDFVYQVVAYKNAAYAETFRSRLTEAGLASRVAVDNGPDGKPRWYRVQMLVQGTEADALAARARLAAREGVRDPLLLSRKAVEKR